MFAALPLQWYVVGSTPLGTARAHQVAFLLFAAVVFARYRLRSQEPILRAAMWFVVANVYMLSIWFLIRLYHGGFPDGPVQQFIYLAVFFAVGAYIYRAGRGLEIGALELLRWAAAGAAAALVVGLVLSMLRNGSNPIAVVSQALASANPELLQRELFRSSFEGYGFDEETVRGNIRHEIFGSILLAMYVASWATRLRPFATTATRVAFRLSMVVCVGLLLISMSRAILIAAAAWPLISFLRSARLFAVSTRQLATAYGAVAAMALVLVSGLGQVLWTRFAEDTGSYTSRAGLYDRAFENIRTHFLTGGVETAGESSHNFVVDAWLQGGILMAIAAAAVLVLLIAAWVVWLVRLPSEADWMLPVTAAFALPIDRMLTSGGGLIPPVEWVTLGFIAGALALRHQHRAEARRRDGVPSVAKVGT